MNQPSNYLLLSFLYSLALPPPQNYATWPSFALGPFPVEPVFAVAVVFTNGRELRVGCAMHDTRESGQTKCGSIE